MARACSASRVRMSTTGCRRRASRWTSCSDIPTARKAVLALAARTPDVPLQVWASRLHTGAENAVRQRGPCSIVRELLRRFASRDEAIQAIVAGGFPLGVAQWMSTNLVRDEDGFVWRLDFDVMDQLLHDFFTTDLWSVVEHLPPKHDLHFLKASESNALSAAGAARLRSRRRPARPPAPSAGRPPDSRGVAGVGDEVDR